MEHPSAVDPPTDPVKQRVVTVQRYHTGWRESTDRMHGDHSPQPAQPPRAVADEPMVGVMRTATVRVGDRDHAGDGAPAGRAHPAADQIGVATNTCTGTTASVLGVQSITTAVSGAGSGHDRCHRGPYRTDTSRVGDP
jgi:hypothetical protein